MSHSCCQRHSKKLLLSNANKCKTSKFLLSLRIKNSIRIARVIHLKCMRSRKKNIHVGCCNKGQKSNITNTSQQQYAAMTANSDGKKRFLFWLLYMYMIMILHFSPLKLDLNFRIMLNGF